jgi:hypothetical protein
MVELPDEIAKGFKGHADARLAQIDAAGNSTDLSADFADKRR